MACHVIIRAWYAGRKVPREKETNVAVLARAAAVLEQLAAAGEVTTADLSEQLDEPRSSVYRLLRSLATLGLVEEGERAGGFRLGLGVLRLGSVALSQLEVRRVALPLLERLHDETGETVFLAVPRKGRALFVDRLDGKRAANMAVAPGESMPLHSGAAPRTLLAFAPRSEWQTYLDEAELFEHRSGAPVSAAAVIHELEQGVAAGFCVSDGDVVEGIATLGAPVLDYRDQVRASISISGLRDDIIGARKQIIVDSLLETAAEASRALGHRSAAAAKEA